jgi:hypothetical protein
VSLAIVFGLVYYSKSLFSFSPITNIILGFVLISGLSVVGLITIVMANSERAFLFKRFRKA